MTRRVRALLVAGVLFVVLVVLAITLPVPYVIMSPGPTYNTLGTFDAGSGKQEDIIVLTGKAAQPVTGHLNLTTVNISTSRVTALQALLGWLKHDQIVVPRASVYPPGQSEQQVNEQDTAQFGESQNNATLAAFCQLGYPKAFGVVSVDATLGANGKLQPGDQILTVGGQPADDGQKLAALLHGRSVGTTVVVGVRRDGALLSIPVTLSKGSDGKTAVLGITVDPAGGCLAPFGVTLGLGGQIGGPSAGLMFALGIIDKVGDGDLTNGAFIAGTGEIDDPATGAVSPIGGIQLKMIAARRAGATVFLAPKDNCRDVRGNIPKGLNVVKVTALSDAVQDLKNLASGQPVPHC